MALLLAGLLLLAPPTPAPEPAKSRSADEISQAIKDLASKRYAVREAASQRLWLAGKSAEPALREAAKSEDAEVAERAKTLLDKYRWGLYPDTPAKVQKIIEQFRAGDISVRRSAVLELLKMKPFPAETLEKVIDCEEDVDAQRQLSDAVIQEIRHNVPEFLIQGAYDLLEKMLESSVRKGGDLAAADYAFFLEMRGKLEASIFHLEKEAAAEKAPLGNWRWHVLTRLYRMKGDWPAAAKAATKASSPGLEELVAWHAQDWKAMSKLPREQERDDYAPVAWMTYPRLAGDKTEYERRLAIVRKEAHDSIENLYLWARTTQALLINGRTSEAITLLSAKKTQLGMGFEILCAQMRFKDAFELVEDARHRDTDKLERFGVEVRRAKFLALAGDKDTAIQLFRKLKEEIIETPDDELLVRFEVRAGLRDLALEHAGAQLHRIVKAGQRERETLASLLEPVFGERRNDALTAWTILTLHDPKADPGAVMAKVDQYLSGKLKPDGLAAASEAYVQPPRRPRRQRFQPDDSEHLPPPSIGRVQGVLAAAYEASGDDAKAEAAYRKSDDNTLNSQLRYGDFLARKKRFADAAKEYARVGKLRISVSQRAMQLQADDEISTDENTFRETLTTYLQGAMLSRAGEKEKGKKLIEAACWMPLADEAIRGELMQELSRRGLHDLARKEAELLLKTGWHRSREYSNAMIYMSRAYIKDKEYGKAANLYEYFQIGLLRTGDELADSIGYLYGPQTVRTLRVRQAVKDGKLDEAVRLARLDIEQTPGSMEGATRLVPALDKADRKKQADEIYELVKRDWARAVKEYPNSAYYHNSIAWLEANCNRDLDEALKHALRATELEPKAAGYIDTLAEVYFRMKDRDKAKALMEKCKALEPNKEYYHRQLLRFTNSDFNSPVPESEEDSEE